LPGAFLRRLLAHPLAASRDLDDPATTEVHRHIIAGKPFLRAIYSEWYAQLARSLPSCEGSVVELGSGAGFCAEFIPGLVTSEVFPCSSAQLVIDAGSLPFADNSLRAVVMTNVLHHLSDVRHFFAEASRCLVYGGKILMIEPWVTPWSIFVYGRLHHESFAPQATTWSFNGTGPLSGANIALPWIVFSRDLQQFTKEFPSLRVEEVRPLMPFRYLVSGGVSLRTLAPAFTHSMWAALERGLESQMHRLAMFAFISACKY
jgi:SAM-dependent methyltransferase